MQHSFMDEVQARVAAALQSGDLQPIEAQSYAHEQADLPFILRWVSTLARKDASTPAAAPMTMPGGPRDPNFNPFKNPDPALLVGTLGEWHNVVLNKFPVCERHLVLARREFEEQLIPLAECDFTVLALIMQDAAGLGFYNGGAAAGASQRHKHVQWVPAAPGNASLALYLPGLPVDAKPLTRARHPALAFRHVFVKLGDLRSRNAEQAGQEMHAAFRLALQALDLAPGEDGLLPPFNLLVSHDWLLVVPRAVECFEGIAIAAINFGGVLYVRQPEQIERLREVGPLAALAAVSLPDA